jgi:hypothetical protein
MSRIEDGKLSETGFGREARGQRSLIWMMRKELLISNAMRPAVRMESTGIFLMIF